MIVPVLKRVSSPEIEWGQLPPDPQNCAVLCRVEIGREHEPGRELFSFVVATPRHFLAKPAVHWGRGYLIMNTFSWQEIERAVDRELDRCRRATWPEVLEELNKVMRWEFEEYQP